MAIAAKTKLVLPPWKGLGGKRNHLPLVLPYLATSHVPEHDRRIVEPFAGTAVVAANHPYHRVWLNDANEAFVNLMRWIVREPDALLDEARDVWRRYGGDGGRDSYLSARDTYNNIYFAGLLPASRAAAFTLFLNKHGFNGLFRLNKQGKFNVPYGKRQAPLPEREIMDYHRAFSLRETEVTSEDFRRVMALCGAGDVVYCDPPYAPISKTSSFIGYGNQWADADHDVLNALAAEATARGAAVVVAASNTPRSREAYRGARMALEIRVQRRVGAAAASRKVVGELVFIY